MDETQKCSHDPENISQKITVKDQSETQKDQSETQKDQSETQKEQSNKPNDQLATSTNQLSKQIDQTDTSKDQSPIPKDQLTMPKVQLAEMKEQLQDQLTEMKGPSLKDQLCTSKCQTAIPREPLAISRDQSTIFKDQYAIFRVQSGTSKALASARDQIAFQKDLLSLLRAQSATSRDQPNSPKYQHTPIGSYSERRSPRNVGSGISFCIARAASATQSYGRINSYLNSYAPLIIKPSGQIPITTQPRLSQLTSPVSVRSVAVRTQPQSLFLQALSKLNESSLTLTVINHLRLLQSTTNLKKVVNLELKSGDITPPDSLTSAPPSYSFVLRQMAVRRRPRLMGTFFPSPSFVQHTPPPTYTTAFDIYIEPVAPPPPARVFAYGFTSMPVACPECGYTGMSLVTARVTICTHLCAFILCLLCCWVCAPLPYVLRSCKEVYHYCRNCRSFLGMYSPTSPESVYQ